MFIHLFLDSFIGRSHIENSLFNIELIQSLIKKQEETAVVDEDISPILTDATGRTKLNMHSEYEANLVSVLDLPVIYVSTFAYYKRIEAAISMLHEFYSIHCFPSRLLMQWL